MKKAVLPLLLLASLLLSACGSRAVQNRFAAFSEALAAREELSFTAELRAEYPDRSLQFTLRYEKAPEGEAITVLAPELIEGVTARLAPGAASLVYDGMILDAGPLDPYGLTPMTALPRLVDALCRGHLDSHWEEDGLLVCRLIPDDHLSVQVWFSEDMTPLRCELLSDGKLSVFCELNDWNTPGKIE